jgi:5'-nucleotidase (lipoprotein e(P4) family)
MKKLYSCSLAVVLLFNACSSSKKVESAGIANNGKVWSALWQQQAAEYKALCFQAYNIAKQRVDEAVNAPGDKSKPFAVITDIDETLLDNSPYDAQKAVNNQEYDSKTWKAWTNSAQADTVPGAPAFFKYAASKGVEVFYITNRDADERAGTIKNLQLYRLPNVDDAHLLTRQMGSSKESRRQNVMQTHNVILLCGDNLADFDAMYDNKPTTQNRAETTRKLIQEFGSRYIVLPNPSYGDFESALFNFNYKLSTAQKDSVIKANLKVK